jgi:hypothetical protein
LARLSQAPETWALACAALYAAAAYCLTPRPENGPPATAAWAPLVVMAAGAGLAALLGAPAGTYARIREVLVRFAPMSLAAAGVLAASIAAGFSPQLQIAWNTGDPRWSVTAAKFATVTIALLLATAIARSFGIHSRNAPVGVRRRLLFVTSSLVLLAGIEIVFALAAGGAR